MVTPSIMASGYSTAARSSISRYDASPIVVARVLNHTPRGLIGVTALYLRHEYGQERRHALNAWAQKIESIIRPAGDDKKVVQLRG